MLKYLTVEKFVVTFTALVSIAAAYVSLSTGYILAYNDATAHLNTARRVFDNLTPGVVQLGSVWLPLLHIFQMPFVANHYLWQSGLAGWAVSGISFVVAGYFIYKLIHYVTNDKFAGFVGVLVMCLNANMLYLQTTAMFEPLLMATASAAVFYLAKWSKEQNLHYLLMGAFFTMLATLTRYDGWALFMAAAAYVFFVTIVVKKKFAEGPTVIFLALAGFGIFLWFLYNLMIFGDPLYFQSGEYSAKAQQDILEQRGALPTKHNFPMSFETYTLAMFLNVGVIVTILFIMGVLYFVIRNVTKPSNYAPLLLVIPYFFNIISLYGGQSVIWLPMLPPHFDTYFNARYGLLMLPAAAFFIAYMAHGKWWMKIPVLPLLVLQAYLFFNTSILPVYGYEIGVITLQDTVSSVNKQTVEASDFLKNNWDYGLIMASSASIDAFIFRTGIPLKNYITEGTGRFWKESLEFPDRHARWLVFFNDKSDRVGRVVGKWKNLEVYFEKVYENQTYQIWRKKLKPGK